MGQSKSSNSGAPARKIARQKKRAPTAKSLTLRTALMVAASVLLLGYGRRTAYAQSYDPPGSCSYTGTVVTCSGDLADGVVVAGGVGVYDTLNITGLSADIVPPAGTQGVKFDAENVTLNIYNTGPYAIETTDTIGIYAASVSGYVTVTSSADITTDGNDSRGIFARTAGNVTVTNSGAIETDGNKSDGIYAQSTGDGDVRVTNSGAIRTNDISSSGIKADAYGNGDVYVTNSGAIATDDLASGIDAKARGTGNVTIENSAEITSYDSGSAAILANADGIGDIVVRNNGTLTAGGVGIGAYGNGGGNISVTNHGTINSSAEGITVFTNEAGSIAIANSAAIATTNNNGEGIYAQAIGDGDVTVANSGTITTEGKQAHAIYAYTGGTGDINVTNSGVVTTEGVDSHGIYTRADGNGDTVVTNSGLVVSERAASMFFKYDSTLNLLAPAFLGGRIEADDGDVAVNITTGPSHSVLWDFSTGNLADGEPVVTGPVEGFFNGTTKQFATFDPSGLAGAVERLQDLTGQLTRIGQTAVAGATLPGYGADLAPDDTVDTGAGRWWAAPFGGTFTHDSDAGALLERDIDQYGIAAGYAFDSQPDLRLGIIAGYAATSLTTDSRFAPSHDIDSSGVFAALDGLATSGPWQIGFGVNGGWMAYDSLRFINDNLAEDSDGATRGNSWANADYDSWFVSPHVSAGYRLTGLADGWSLTPTVRARYGYEAVGGYSESGAWTDGANARVGSRNLGFVEGAFELAAEKPFLQGGVTGTWTARAGVVARRSTGDDAVPITLIGIDQAVDFGDTDTTALYAGLGADIDLPAGGELTLDGQGWFGDDIQGASGMLRYTIRR